FSVQAWKNRQASESPRPGGRPSDTVRVNEQQIVENPLSEELRKLSTRLVETSQQLDEENKVEFVSTANRCLVLIEQLEQWLAQGLEGQVYWIETSGEHTQRLSLCNAPIGVGPALKEQLYEVTPTVILTSATLSVGGAEGFSHFQQRLGLDECATLQLGSPFNYPEQAEMHLFRTMPDPSADPAGFEEAVLEKIEEYVLAS